MSLAIATVATVDSIKEHPDPETTELQVAEILGWQCVINKSNNYREGQVVLFIPPDMLISSELAVEWKVDRYLNESKHHPGLLRTKQLRLRGEASYGLTLPVPENLNAEVGDNVAKLLGIQHYEPPIRNSGGPNDSVPQHPLFPKYTDIENARNYKNIFIEGEEVIITEKLHGTNSRIGFIEGDVMAGSHRLQRYRPSDEDMSRNMYWYPYTLESVQAFIEDAQGSGDPQHVLYGEVIGSPVQNLHYGFQGKLGFFAFDILTDGNYLDYDDFVYVCDSYKIPRVPELYRGPFSWEVVEALSNGPTTLGKGHIREGVVVKPLKEEYTHAVGRKVLKYIGSEYMFNKKKTDYADV